MQALREVGVPAVSGPASEKLREKLDVTVSFKPDAKWTPGDALEFLAQRYDLPLVVKAPEARRSNHTALR